MTTLSITSLDRNTQSRKARAPHRWAVLAFGVAWYGALLAAAVLPAQASAAQVGGHAAQAGVKDTAVTHRVPGTCTPYRCR
jgi:hypothetical protein